MTNPLRPFQPETPRKAEIGIGEFTLFARVSDTTNYKSRSPVSFVEDGSALDDHIINEPLSISIEGEVGDIYLRKSPAEREINRANAAIGQTSIYLPARTQSQLQKINALASTVRDRIREIERLRSLGKNILDKFKGRTDGKSPQEQFIDQMEAAHNQKALIKIDMPFRQYDNMRIQNLSFTRKSESGALRFKLDAAQLRIAQPLYRVNSLVGNAASGVENQLGAQSNKGAQEGKEPSQSFASYLGGLF